MRPTEQTEYIVQCVRDAGSMYEQDACAFLAEHDAHVHTEALTEGARLLEDAACDADWNRTADYCQGLRAGAELLLAKTTEAGDR